MINHAITLSLLIAVVMLLRAIFRKKVPQRLIYALWLVVIIKMCLPFAFFTLDIPALPGFYPNAADTVVTDTTAVFETEIKDTSVVTNPPITQPPETLPPSVTAKPIVTAPAASEIITAPSVTAPSVTAPSVTAPSVTAPPEVSRPAPAEPKQNVFDLGKTLFIISLLGSVAVGAFFSLSAFQLSSKLRSDRVFLKKLGRISVYISQNAITPCVFGLIPKIYLTPEAAGSEKLETVLRHELTHIRHGDNLWAVVRTAALVVFWWNPLVWAAAVLSKRDSELACDEAVASHLDADKRIAYAHTIVDFIPQKGGHAHGLSGAPIKERLIMLTGKRKTSVICVILALVLALSAAGCSFIGAKPQTPELSDDVEDDVTDTKDTDKKEPSDTTEPKDTTDPGVIDTHKKDPYVTSIIPRPLDFAFGENVVQVNTFETPACSNYPDYANSFVADPIYGTTDYLLLRTYRIDYPERGVNVISKSSVYLFNTGLGKIEASAKLPDAFRTRHSVMQDDGSVIISGYDESDVSFVLSRDSTLESIDYVHIEDPRDAAIFEKTFVSPDGKTKVQNIYKESVKIIYPSGEEKTVLPRVDNNPYGMYATVSFACGFIDNERFVYDQLNGYIGIYNVNTHENVVYENSGGQTFVALGEDGIYTWGYSSGGGFNGKVGLLDRDGVFHVYEVPEIYSGIFGLDNISFCNGKWAVITDNELYVFSYDLKTILAQADLPQNRALHRVIINGDRISLFFSEEKETDSSTEPDDTTTPEDTTTEPDDTTAEPPELSEELKLEIQKAYVENYNKNNPDKPITQEDTGVYGYCGEYSGAHVVTILRSGCQYPAIIESIIVNGEEISYSYPPPSVYKNGKFYGVESAFEKGILSAEDIKALAEFTKRR